jgi:hypothetical protein
MAAHQQQQFSYQLPKYNNMHHVAQAICNNSSTLNQEEFDNRLAQLMIVQYQWLRNENINILDDNGDSIELNNEKEILKNDDTQNRIITSQSSTVSSQITQIIKYNSLAKGCSVGRKPNVKRPAVNGVLSAYTGNTTATELKADVPKSPPKNKNKKKAQIKQASTSRFLPDVEQPGFPRSMWLTTDNICTALDIISRDYKLGGLCSPGVFSLPQDQISLHIKTFSPFSAYIVHTGNHWITVSNTNPNVDSETGTTCDWVVYSSIDSRKYLPYTKPLFEHVAELDKGFRGKYESVTVEQQEGSCDCGLFALAYVLAIANKRDPAKLKFSQSVMRAHYNTCIELKKFTEFESVPVDIDPVYKEHRFNSLLIKKK